MAKQFEELSQNHQDFISRQHIFFTGSAAPTGKVNISPRSTEMFRIIGPNSVAYLDFVGSGNETAAHLRQEPRLTMMFCAVSGAPQIMRLYGQGHAFLDNSSEYATLLKQHFEGIAPRNARQIVQLDIDIVQTSCGFGVPLLDYVDERDALTRWADHKTDEELLAFRQEKNATSIDGFDTGYLKHPKT
jgi:hypothetical protein